MNAPAQRTRSPRHALRDGGAALLKNAGPLRALIAPRLAE
jgi:hypothetical protein